MCGVLDIPLNIRSVGAVVQNHGTSACGECESSVRGEHFCENSFDLNGRVVVTENGGHRS